MTPLLRRIAEARTRAASGFYRRDNAVVLVDGVHQKARTVARRSDRTTLVARDSALVDQDHALDVVNTDAFLVVNDSGDNGRRCAAKSALNALNNKCTDEWTLGFNIYDLEQMAVRAEEANRAAQGVPVAKLIVFDKTHKEPQREWSATPMPTIEVLKIVR